MVDVTLYPGCSLEGTAQDYRDSLEIACSRLGVNLIELENWICCGATAAHSLDEFLALEFPARNLVLAEKRGLDVVVPCALCFNRLKTTEKHLLKNTHPELTKKYPFKGTIKIHDLLAYLTTPDMLKGISSLVKKPLEGLKLVSYYGCMVNRPPRITDAQNHENPTQMDRLVETLGATAIDWPFKTDCCGASHVVARPDLVFVLVKKLYDRAIAQEANGIVVSCQMCHANLDMYQDQISEYFGERYHIPVFYFTELINLAFGDERQIGWLSRHVVDPLPTLRECGLI
ncbi:MAG: CoB--CoM heterodisulfide reductase iron-sulfur subunit B family protein [Syntrophobacterales bacterium]|nr:CoB--CoM heterodisulfide reductase iron-sulfur subunit B family protein [Syntrophobacterales bacterium]